VNDAELLLGTGFTRETERRPGPFGGRQAFRPEQLHGLRSGPSRALRAPPRPAGPCANVPRRSPCGDGLLLYFARSLPAATGLGLRFALEKQEPGGQRRWVECRVAMPLEAN